jgi:hypothetical protein
MPTKRTKSKRAEVEPELPEAPPPLERPLPVIKVVGISGSGKSTLVSALRADGYDARPVSQEHSKVANLWQQFDRPTYLVYLNASLENQRARRQDVTWSAAALEEETARLAHAREHADLRIDTGGLAPSGVYQLIRSYLIRRRVRHAKTPLEERPATGSAFKSKSGDGG